MRKDYAPISEIQKNDDEISFVSQYWTNIWSQEDIKLYDPSFFEQHEYYKLILPYLNRLGRGAKILDGGCGLGKWTIFLNSKGYDVTGVDISKETIDKLITFSPVNRFVCGDIRRTDFASDSFDAYYAWGTFEHFEMDIEACFLEAQRILKPSGFLFVAVPYENKRLHRQDEMMKYLSKLSRLSG